MMARQELNARPHAGPNSNSTNKRRRHVQQILLRWQSGIIESLSSSISIPFPRSIYQMSVLSLKSSKFPLHSELHFFSSKILSKTIKMVRNLTGLGLPGIVSNISNIDQCTPALCDISRWGTVSYIPSLGANAIYGGLFALLLCVQPI